MNVDILLNSDARASEVAAVKKVAREEGFCGSVQAVYASRGLGDFPWVIILLVPLSLFFKAYLEEIGKAAGRDTYQGFRRLVARLFDARGNSNGSVSIEDKQTRTYIILTNGLPVEAYLQLAEMSVEQLEGGYWTWDSRQKKWERL